MLYLVGFICIVLIVAFPGWWVNRTLRKYSIEYDALPGTGGELAQHLATRFSLPIKIEETDLGDHYDPKDKTVRLTKNYLSGRSLSAVAVAAHEVGHAIQDHSNYRWLKLRTRLAKIAIIAEKIGGIAFLILPVIALVSRSPILSGLFLLAVILSMGISVLVHLITLPVEWDASFNRALPILEQGNYLSSSELKAARKILLAAALTYVASALMSLVNVWRWLRILRIR
ncbi:zinc metallopeptidase [Pleionea sediminis]|uniref:zinc metallopeptidase n=1 Tax=Pleionea sediminis TaxID=2569479 RepID=UPI001185B2A4|nr:zinc metallopeptidase [Pleionea sediminis]